MGAPSPLNGAVRTLMALMLSWVPETQAKVAYNLGVCNSHFLLMGATKSRALVKRLQGSTLTEDTLVDEEWFVIPWVFVPTAALGLTNPNCSKSRKRGQRIRKPVRALVGNCAEKQSNRTCRTENAVPTVMVSIESRPMDAKLTTVWHQRCDFRFTTCPRAFLRLTRDKLAA